MKSAMPLILLLAAAPLVTACAGSTQVLAPASGCSSLIPAPWVSAPIPSAIAPAEDGDETAWQVFGIEQTGQLAKANGRTADVVAIVKSCEARDAASMRHINRPTWAFWR